MKLLKLMTVAALAILVTSCGGKKDSDEAEDVVVTPETTTVSGPLGECFTVVDRSYKCVHKIIGYEITVEFERTDADAPFELNGRELTYFGHSSSDANVQVGFGIELLDADGNIIDKKEATRYPNTYSEPVELMKLRPGEKGSMSFSLDSDAKDATQFRITSSYQENEAKPESDSSSSSDDSDEITAVDSDDDDDDESASASASSSNSEDWDEVLDSYEEYVDQYIALLKKAQNGDMSAMAEYAKMLEKAQGLNKKLASARSTMSAKQVARYTKIIAKMANVK